MQTRCFLAKAIASIAVMALFTLAITQASSLGPADPWCGLSRAAAGRTAPIPR